MTTARILLADDQVLIRVGIRALLESLGGYEIISECSDGTQAISDITRLEPDVVLLDIAMPGPSGIEVARAIREAACKVRILVLSSIDRKEVIEQAMTAGVDGYLLKDFILEELQEALATVLQGRQYFSPRIKIPYGAACLPGGKLTARQIEVLRLVASGRTTKEIARELGISPKTVEFHRGRLMERIGTHDVAGLTRFALRSGVLFHAVCDLPLPIG